MTPKAPKMSPNGSPWPRKSAPRAAYGERGGRAAQHEFNGVRVAAETAFRRERVRRGGVCDDWSVAVFGGAAEMCWGVGGGWVGSVW